VFSRGTLSHSGGAFSASNAAGTKKIGIFQNIPPKTLVLQRFMIYILLVACGGVVFHE
jgi:hypothetical protein